MSSPWRKSPASIRRMSAPITPKGAPFTPTRKSRRTSPIFEMICIPSFSTQLVSCGLRTVSDDGRSAEGADSEGMPPIQQPDNLQAKTGTQQENDYITFLEKRVFSLERALVLCASDPSAAEPAKDQSHEERLEIARARERAGPISRSRTPKTPLNPSSQSTSPKASRRVPPEHHRRSRRPSPSTSETPRQHEVTPKRCTVAARLFKFASPSPRKVSVADESEDIFKIRRSASTPAVHSHAGGDDPFSFNGAISAQHAPCRGASRAAQESGQHAGLGLSIPRSHSSINQSLFSQDYAPVISPRERQDVQARLLPEIPPTSPRLSLPDPPASMPASGCEARVLTPLEAYEHAYRQRLFLQESVGIFDVKNGVSPRQSIVQSNAHEPHRAARRSLPRIPVSASDSTIPAEPVLQSQRHLKVKRKSISKAQSKEQLDEEMRHQGIMSQIEFQDERLAVKEGVPEEVAEAIRRLSADRPRGPKHPDLRSFAAIEAPKKAKRKNIPPALMLPTSQTWNESLSQAVSSPHFALVFAF